MKFEIDQVSDRITPSITRIQRDLVKIPAGAHKTWVANTPVRTGNARRRTSLRGDTIRADYAYAVPLDQGRSPQSPQGMVRPTLRWLQTTLRRLMRK
jgi:hypothetical protein